MAPPPLSPVPPERLLSWPQLLAWRSRARAEGEEALRGLAHGDTGPVARMLESWRFSKHETPLRALLERLMDAPPDASPHSLSAVLGPESALPAPPRADPRRALADWRAWLEPRVTPAPASTPDEARLWALCELSRLGADRDHMERSAWRRSYDPSPQDPLTRRAWEGWFRMDLTAVWGVWAKLFERAARRGTEQASASRRIPTARGARLLADEGSDFLFACIGGSDGEQPWREIATRVVEADPRGPVAGLALHLDDASWARAVRCVSEGATWRRSIGEPGAFDALSTSAAGPGEPQAELSVDLHLTLRLLRAWQSPAKTSASFSSGVLYENLRRARGRMRALLRDQPGEALRAALLARDALYARTRQQVTAYFWSWAHHALSVDGAGAPHLVTRPCALRPLPPEPPAPSPDSLAQERAWVLLALLRGQREPLRRWAEHGGETAGGLARLLTQTPAALLGVREGAHQDHRPLRAAMSARLDAHEAALRPALAAVAALPTEPARGRRERVLGALSAHWHPALALPEHGFPSMIAEARALCAEAGSTKEQA